jgi:phospholipid/cholesterol/gamma-HCH transport system permease protein
VRPAAAPAFAIESRPAGGVLELSFSGALRLEEAAQWLDRAREAAGASGSVRFALARLERLDGGSAALLVRLAEDLEGAGRSVEWSGVGGRVAQILELYSARRRIALGAARRPGFVEQVGGATLELLASARDVLGMLGAVILATGAALRHPRSVPWREVVRLMERSGVDALPIVALITFLTGLVTAFQAAIQLHRVGADLFIADAVALSMARELGPLMTAIIAAGRSGAAFAAELGTMSVSEEVDALRTLGLDPQRYLVLPRLLALLAMLPLLTLLADLIGVLGGLLVAAVSLDIVPIAYLEETRKAVVPWDVISGLLKSLAFALGIGLAACQRGLAARGGADGVGRATTSAVVTSLFLLIAIDSVFTMIYHVFEL